MQEATQDSEATDRSLTLDLREAGEIFDSGLNTFSSYEDGKTNPPLALTKLPKVLNHYSEPLDEIGVEPIQIREAVLRRDSTSENPDLESYLPVMVPNSSWNVAWVVLLFPP